MPAECKYVHIYGFGCCAYRNGIDMCAHCALRWCDGIQTRRRLEHWNISVRLPACRSSSRTCWQSCCNNAFVCTREGETFKETLKSLWLLVNCFSNNGCVQFWLSECYRARVEQAATVALLTFVFYFVFVLRQSPWNKPGEGIERNERKILYRVGYVGSDGSQKKCAYNFFSRISIVENRGPGYRERLLFLFCARLFS